MRSISFDSLSTIKEESDLPDTHPSVSVIDPIASCKKDKFAELESQHEILNVSIYDSMHRPRLFPVKMVCGIIASIFIVVLVTILIS